MHENDVGTRLREEAADWMTRLLPVRDREPGGDERVEAHVLWGDVLLGTRRTGRDGRLTIGGARGRLWRLGGVPVGWVPPALAPWLAVTPPGLSTADLEPRVDVDVGDALGDDAEEALVELVDGVQVVVLREGWPCAALTADGWLDVDGLVTAGLAERVGRLVHVPVRPDVRLAVQVAGLTVLLGTAPAGARAAWTAWVADRALRGSGLLVLAAAMVLGVLTASAPDRLPPPVTLPTQDDAGPPPPTPAFVLEVADFVPPPQPARPDATGGPRTEAPGGVGARRTPRPGGGGSPGGAGLAASMFAGLGGPGLDGLTGGVDALVGGRAVSLGGGLGGPGRLGAGIGDGSGPGGGVGRPGPGGGGPGGGPVALERSKPRPPKELGEPEVLGPSMPRELIDAVIKRHLAQIRTCYQRELQSQPDLAGKLVVRFAIAKDGTVSSASRKDGSLDDPEVTACVIGWFRRMTFPEPPGGGLVLVSYPFTFAPA